MSTTLLSEIHFKFEVVRIRTIPTRSMLDRSQMARLVSLRLPLQAQQHLHRVVAAAVDLGLDSLRVLEL
jgi:hypothetical protein